MQPKIHIDNFLVEDTQITAYSIIDGADIDFHISRDEFEAWGDENDMRTWEEPIPSWEEIYSGWGLMANILGLYIKHLYQMDEMDFEPAMQRILTNPS